MSRSTVVGAVVAAAAVAGCATVQISVPVTGQFAGQAAAGQATGRGDGNGDFWVQVPGGIRCSGTYNSVDSNPTIVVPIRCSDGKVGQAVVSRQLNGLSGTALVSLSDGRKGQFVFGDLRFEQAFGQGGRAKVGGS